MLKFKASFTRTMIWKSFTSFVKRIGASRGWCVSENKRNKNFVPTLKCDNGASKLLFEINSKDYWIMLLLIIIIVVVISAGVMQVWQRSCCYGYKSSTFWAIHTRDYSAWWFLLKNCSSQWKKAYLQLHIYTDPLRILNSFLVFLEILCKFSYLPTFRILILASAGISSSSSL